MTKRNEANEVAVVSEDIQTLDNVTANMFAPEEGLQFFFSSIQDNGSRESKIAIYNAISEAENNLSDHLGEIIEIQDMVAHAIELDDEQSGEKVKAMRVVLLTKDGVGYQSVSTGVVSSLQRIIGIVGQAPWTPAIRVIPIEKKTRKGFKTLTIRLAV